MGLCFSSVKIANEEIKCSSCNITKNIITLDCKHRYCVKCYNKSKYFCKECEKNKSYFKTS
jgi:hypothetical protein